MYIVGFYSPKPKSGVTEISLEIFKWLKNNTELSIGFVSRGVLESEPKGPSVIDNFSALSLQQRRAKLKSMRNKFDITIFDVSNKHPSDILQVVPSVDRLFITGEENLQFAETVHNIIQFNKQYGNPNKQPQDHAEGNKTFILHESKDQVIGFSKNKNDIGESAYMIYCDYCTFSLEKKHSEGYLALIEKIKTFKVKKLAESLHRVGFDFEKAVLIEKFAQLRIALGQPYTEVIDDLFPIVALSDYETILKQFQNEIYVAKISFDNQDHFKGGAKQ